MSRLPVSGAQIGVAVAIGVFAGAAYTLSPLMVVTAPALLAIVWYAASGLPQPERRWVIALVVAAIVLRLAAIAGLFLATDHHRVVAGTFFGDESYYIKRTLLMRSLAISAPFSPEDIVDVFEDIGDVAYLHLLAFVQVMFGPAPYGLRVVNVACYVLGCVVFFRAARRAFGALPATVGLAVCLFMPSLFVWSVSILKEAMLALATALVLVAAIAVVRSPWQTKVAAIVGGICAAAASEGLRYTAGITTAGGAVLGYLMCYATSKPMRALRVVAAIPLVALVVYALPPMHARAMDFMKRAAIRHRGHVFTVGFAYRLLDERLYGDEPIVQTMTDGEAARFAFRAVVHFVFEPTPGNTRSIAAIAYLPEQLVWFAMLFAVPGGVRTAIRADRLVTLLLLGAALPTAFLIAISGGNVGTLVRHRGTVMLYLSWLSAVGWCDIAARVGARARHGAADHPMRISNAVS